MANTHSNGHDSSHHIIPTKILNNTFYALLALTLFTVASSRIIAANHDMLSWLSIPLAIAIAVVKTSLVVLFFMGIKYDKPINGVIAGLMALFVVIFLTFTLLDTTTRTNFNSRFAVTKIEQQRLDRIGDVETRMKKLEEGLKKAPLTPADYKNAATADTTKKATPAAATPAPAPAAATPAPATKH